MDFFDQQHEARRKTRWMVLLFIPAVIGVVTVVDFVVGMTYIGVASYHYQIFPTHYHAAPSYLSHYSFSYIPHRLLQWTTGITLTAILAQTLYTMYKLRDGGCAIAAAFDARWVDPDTRNPKERQLINVVEEMAIASGVRVPSVYLLDDERGLNACAAGNGVSDAIIVVTSGLLDKLDRDELQGVIGHEFSHILNGDMALNMRMMGILSGIVTIGSTGFFMMRNGLIFWMFGLVLGVVGYTGLLFARLIKAAVSREREFLADASSVQFTRNPDGIVGALEKMRTTPAGTLIQNRYAEEASHMFFGPSIRPWMAGLLASHPPLINRIKRIMPNFSELVFNASKRIAARAAQAKAPSQAKAQSRDTPQPGVNIPAVPGSAMIAGLASAEAGRASDAKVQVKAWAGQMAMAYLAGGASSANAARRLINSISPYLYQKTRIPYGASAVVLALMLARKDEVRDAQLAAVEAAGMKPLAEAAAALEPATRQLAEAMRFPLIDLALPVIKSAALKLRKELLTALEVAISADSGMSTHALVVLTLIQFQAGEQHPPAGVKYNSLEAVREDASWLLTLVAYAGCGATDESARQKEFETAFAAGVQQMKLADAAPAARNTFNQQTAMAALGRLRQLEPMEKSRLIQGLYACVMADNTIRVIEAEMMRTVGAVLDCPLPPLIEQVETAAA